MDEARRDAGPSSSTSSSTTTSEAEAVIRAAYEEARRAADQALAANNPGMAAHVYVDLLTKIPAAHPLAVEARYHRALLLETAGFLEVAIPILVELGHQGHEGAWKALDRLLEQRWTTAREAPPGPDGRPAREALRAFVDRLGPPTPQRGAPALTWLDTAEAEEHIRTADQAYQKGDYTRAAMAFEEAGNRARVRGVAALAKKALGQAAAVYWHNLHDLSATLRVLAALGPAVAENPGLKAIHEKVAAALADDLRALIRRGDRREAFIRLSAAFPLLPPGQRETDELVDIYLRELASHHIAAIDNRLIAIGRSSDQATRELASPEGAAIAKTDPADAVAARLRLGALTEEHERLAAIRREMYAREMAILRAANVTTYLELLESSRESGALGVLLDRIHRLTLERMHYQVKVKSETKDMLASLLPDFLAHRLVDDTFALIRQLELEVDALAAQFLAHAYPAPK